MQTMKIAALALLLLATPALAHNAGPQEAVKEPCITVAEATKIIEASRKDCKLMLQQEWFHICRNQVVQNHVVQDDQSVYPDNVCPTK
jgi:hypothetical protein